MNLTAAEREHLEPPEALLDFIECDECGQEVGADQITYIDLPDGRHRAECDGCMTDKVGAA